MRRVSGVPSARPAGPSGIGASRFPEAAERGVGSQNCRGCRTRFFRSLKWKSAGTSTGAALTSASCRLGPAASDQTLQIPWLTPFLRFTRSSPRVLRSVPSARPPDPEVRRARGDRARHLRGEGVEGEDQADFFVESPPIKTEAASHEGAGTLSLRTLTRVPLPPPLAPRLRPKFEASEPPIPEGEIARFASARWLLAVPSHRRR